jgi:hypothetical protein
MHQKAALEEMTRSLFARQEGIGEQGKMRGRMAARLKAVLASPLSHVRKRRLRLIH